MDKEALAPMHHRVEATSSHSGPAPADSERSTKESEIPGRSLAVRILGSALPVIFLDH
jgi:hypothetical protein